MTESGLSLFCGINLGGKRSRLNQTRGDLRKQPTEAAPSSHKLHANSKVEIRRRGRRRRRGGGGAGAGGGGMQDRGNQSKVLTIQTTRYTFSGGLTATH